MYKPRYMAVHDNTTLQEKIFFSVTAAKRELTSAFSSLRKLAIFQRYRTNQILCMFYIIFRFMYSCREREIFIFSDYRLREREMLKHTFRGRGIFIFSDERGMLIHSFGERGIFMPFIFTDERGKLIVQL